MKNIYTKLLATLRFLNPFQKKQSMKTSTELTKLIAETKGRFFSITFKTNSGAIRTVNGKDFYRRLLQGGKSTHGTAYESFVDRNKESWKCASDQGLVTFKCGSILKTVQG